MAVHEKVTNDIAKLLEEEADKRINEIIEEDRELLKRLSER